MLGKGVAHRRTKKKTRRNKTRGWKGGKLKLADLIDREARQ